MEAKAAASVARTWVAWPRRSSSSSSLDVSGVFVVLRGSSSCCGGVRRSAPGLAVRLLLVGRGASSLCMFGCSLSADSGLSRF